MKVSRFCISLFSVSATSSSRLGLLSTTQRYRKYIIIGWLIKRVVFVLFLCVLRVVGACMFGVCVWSTSLGHLRFRVLLRLLFALVLLSQFQKLVPKLSEKARKLFLRGLSRYSFKPTLWNTFKWSSGTAFLVFFFSVFFSGEGIQSATPFRHTQNSCSAMHSRKPSQNVEFWEA